MPMHQTIIQGNLGGDPETRSLPSGQEVANFRVAVTEKWKDKDGDMQEHTEWYSVTAFGKTAEVAAQYLHKGDSTMIIGRNRTRKWEDKDGNDRYSTDLLVDKLVLLDNRGRDGGGSSRDRDDDRGSKGSNKRDRDEKPSRERSADRGARGGRDTKDQSNDRGSSRSTSRDSGREDRSGRREPEVDKDFDDDIPF